MHNNIEGSVKQHISDTAFVTDINLVLPRNLLKELEVALAEDAEGQVTNQTIYEIDQGDDITYIQFRHHDVLFGREMQPR